MPTKLLLSIKPRFAEAILNGTKRFEFRRAIFRRNDIRTVILYASSPVQRVVGEFTLEQVLSLEPGALWIIASKASGIDKSYFDSYFEGRDTAHALKVRHTRRYRTPLKLADRFGMRRPPQSYCYVQ